MQEVYACQEYCWCAKTVHQRVSQLQLWYDKTTGFLRGIYFANGQHCNFHEVWCISDRFCEAQHTLWSTAYLPKQSTNLQVFELNSFYPIIADLCMWSCIVKSSFSSPHFFMKLRTHTIAIQRYWVYNTDVRHLRFVRKSNVTLDSDIKLEDRSICLSNCKLFRTFVFRTALVDWSFCLPKCISR